MAAGGFNPDPNQAPQGWPPGPPGPPAPRPYNQLAIASLICAVGQLMFWFVAGIPAVILGHMARRQIRKTHENGDGLALAGLVLGYIGVGLTLFAVIAGIGFFLAWRHHSTQFPATPPMLGNPG